MVQQVQSVRTVIRGDSTPFVQATRRASAAMRRHRSTVRNTTRDYNAAEASTARLSRGFIALTGRLAAFASVAGTISLGASLVQAGLEIERLEQRMRFALGGIEAGAEGLQFVRLEAERLGISFVSAAQGYSGLAASARGTTIAAEEVREIFLGIAEAAAVLRLDTDQTRRAFRALEQIISKGKVSAEELRGQLGENLPGAVQIMGRALGVTTLELDKFLEQGQLSADALVPFARQIREEFGEGVADAVTSSAASFNRLSNSMRQLQQNVAQSGLLEFFTKLVDALNRAGVAIGAFEELDQRRIVGGLREELLGADEAAARVQARVIELGQQLASVSGRDDAIGRNLASVYARQVSEAEAQLAALQERQRTLRQQIADVQNQIPGLQPPTAAPEDPLQRALFDGSQDTARERAEERANARLLRLRERFENQAARVGVDAVGRVEQARIEALRNIERLEADGGGAEAAAAARLALETSTARQISQIRSEELRKALEDEARLEAAAAQRTLRNLAAEQSARVDILAITQEEVQTLRERTLEIQAQAQAEQNAGQAPSVRSQSAEFAGRLQARLVQEERAARLQLSLAIERQRVVDNEQTRDAVRNAQFRVEALAAELGQVAQTTQRYREQFEELVRATEQLEEIQRIRGIANDVTSAITGLASSAITDFDNIGEAARRAGQAIAELILQQTVIQPIGGLISGGIGDIVGAAFGNAIGGSSAASFTAPPPGIGPQFQAPRQNNNFYITGSDEATVRRAIVESAPQLADISVGRATQQLNQRSAFQQAVRRN